MSAAVVRTRGGGTRRTLSLSQVGVAGVLGLAVLGLVGAYEEEE